MATMFNHFLALFLLFALAITPVFSEDENDIPIPEVPVEFSAQLYRSPFGNTFLALHFKNKPHWHTYWKNPGDAGLPIQVDLIRNGKPLLLEGLTWPSPSRFIETGNMWAYGYQGNYSIFYKISKKVLKSLDGSRLEIKSKWLVCRHVCIPGKAELKGSVSGETLAFDQDGHFQLTGNELQARLKALPFKSTWPTNLDLLMAKDKESNGLVLYYNVTGSSPNKMLKGRNLLTPFAKDPFSFKHEFLYSDKNGNIFAKMPMDWDGEYEEPPIDLPSDGRFQKPYVLSFLYANPTTGKVELIEKKIDRFQLAAAKRMESFFSLLKPISDIPKVKTEANGEDSAIIEEPTVGTTSDTKSLIYYLFFAFLGGLILNIMPCVLPIISIKLFGLLKMREEDGRSILKHNLFYTLGILTTFLALAFVILGLKAGGEFVGWGFQLQSPKFVAGMIIILLVFALNMFGLFEIITPGGSKLGGVKIKEGNSGDFFNGVLAVILSTPCSAPFLGTALTFAFTSSPIYILLTFTFIGLGLAFPFLITGIFPNSINFLPKPGMWMEKLKKFLGLTLLLTVVWLLDVFSAQVDQSLPVLQLHTTMLLIFFIIYGRKYISKKLSFLLPFSLISLALFGHLLFSPLSSTVTGAETQLIKDKQKFGLNWEAWSPEKMQELKQTGELVFIDFTAKWCFTCKVNERLVLETEDFKKLVETYGVRLLLADWTKRDATIGNYLKSQGLVGVPAYFIITRNGETISLGETISIKEIESHLR
ncbi:MAG: hypothetical protein HN509_14565 [Halobacteriovoraceae bacterium]|jgi:thiol:disulfide interchange protein/DsbC/DsbD-like thiol-disulfide interchange protein|nr:hypothetical protein [Halobacteriovoraceae bacterium]MBT5094799.1 hypothetical protein [Halobacteriovoraceae bacterium]